MSDAGREPLWTPPPDRVARANLTAFSAAIRREYAADVGDSLAVPLVDHVTRPVLARRVALLRSDCRRAEGARAVGSRGGGFGSHGSPRPCQGAKVVPGRAPQLRRELATAARRAPRARGVQ